MIHSKSEVAIVVLNFNGIALLKRFLPTVVQYSKNHTIFLVDNASTDASVSYVQTHFPSIKCIVHEENHGVSKAYNLALEQIHATYYVLLNNDVLVTEHWLQDMLFLMEEDKSIALCQPKICSLVAPNWFEYAGAAGGFIDVRGYPFCRGRIFNNLEQDTGQYNDKRAIFWASGACLLVRARAFHALGGFDPLFFAHFDEIDLCWRAHLFNWKVYYCGSSTVYHLGGGSLPYTHTYKTYLNFRNRALMLHKYHSFFFCTCMERFFWDVLAAFRMCLLGKFAHGWAIIKAQLDFFKLRKQCKTYYMHRFYLLPTVYTGNMVIDFFIKKKRRFSELLPKRFT